MQTAIRVKGNTSPPNGAELTGELVRWGGENHPVYRQLKPWVQRSKVVPLTDDQGNQIYKYHPNGERFAVKTHRVEDPDVDPYEEYIIEDAGNGITRKNYHFRETVAEVKRREAEAQLTPENLLAQMERLRAENEAILKSLGLSKEDVVQIQESQAKDAAVVGGGKGRK